MNAVSTQEMLSIQQDAAKAACDKPCVIQAKVATKDVDGSETEDWVTTSPSDQMVGMSEPSGGQLANYAYIVGDLATWQLKFPIGTNVNLQNHVIVEGQTMVVQVDLTPRSYPALITVLATEVKQQ